MGLIESIFGKAEHILKDDVDREVLSKLKEGMEIEFKEINNLNKDKEQIIAPLVSFLNSTGEGLLFLGLREKDAFAKEIIPINPSIIKNEEQLRAIIVSNIDSIPRLIDFPKLKILGIDVENQRKIYVIEIKNHDDRYVYSSKITGKTYIRRSDESFPLRLIDVFELIAKKNYPKIFIRFEKSIKTVDKIEIKCFLFNDGLEPGRYITSTIELLYDDGGIIPIFTGGSIRELPEWNEENKKAYQLVTAYPQKGLLVYPKVHNLIGKMILPNKNFKIDILIKTYENKGFSMQKFSITNELNETEIKELESFFSPYLAL